MKFKKPVVDINSNDYNSFAKSISAEAMYATVKYGAMSSLHEAYAVILEELDEFWEIVRQKSEARSADDTYEELKHIAAMCCKTAATLIDREV